MRLFSCSASLRKGLPQKCFHSIIYKYFERGGILLENEVEKDYTEIDLVEVFHVLVDNLRNILVVTVCCVLIAGGYLFAKRGMPTYTSEACLQVKPVAQVLMGNRQLSGENGKLNPANISMSDGLNTTERMQTCAEIMKSKSVLRPVVETIGEMGSVATEPVKNTRLLKVKFSASTPEKAQKGNELLIQSFQSYLSGKEQSETRYITEDGAAGKKSAEVEAVVVGHNEAEIVDAPTLPTAPDAKNEKRTLAISALLGILLGSGYAVMKALMDRRLTTERDVEDYLGLPVLGVVPEEASLAAAMEKLGEKSLLGQIGGFLWK